MLQFIKHLSYGAHVLALILAGAIGIGALISLIVPWKVKFSKRQQPSGYRAAMAALVLAACTVIVTDAVTIPTPSSDARAVVVIDVPEPALPDNPPSLVTCRTSIQGSGHLPAGDVLVIGNRESGSQNYFYQPIVTWDGDKWSAVIYIGGRQDAGRPFIVTAVVMPTAMETYLIAVYHMAQPSATWWAAPGSIPAPAFVAAQETVQRSHSEVGCT
jgi:hypothetical protein